MSILSILEWLYIQMNMEWDFLCGYCISSQVLMIFLTGTAYMPHGYWISTRVLQISPCIMCVQYIQGMFSTLGNTMSTLEDIMSTLRGYHEYIRGCSVHKVFTRNWKVFVTLLLHMHHDITWCTYDIPWCTHDIPRCTCGISQCTEHPLMYWTHYTGWIFLMDTHTIEKCSTCEEDNQYLWGISTVAWYSLNWG